MSVDTKPNPIGEWIKGHLIASAFIALGLVVLLGIFLASLGGGGADELVAPTLPPDLVDATTTTLPTDGPTDDPNRPEVEQLECAALLNDDDVDPVFFGEDATGARGMFVFSQGETCRFEADDDRSRYVLIEPGDPADFAAGTTLGGIAPEPVEGVGDVALWFDDGEALGVLSVGVDLDEAALIYRIHIGLADLDSDSRLEAATSLASTALTRFPGVTAEEEPQPEPQVVEFENAPVDQAPQTVDDVLFHGVEAGEWTLGEGLIGLLDQLATDTPGPLDAMAGESASIVVATAQAYATGGEEDAAAVAALLDQLSALPELQPGEDSDPDAAAGLLVSAMPMAAEDEGCVAPEGMTCPLVFAIEGDPNLDDDKYAVWVLSPGPWTDIEGHEALQVLRRSAETYEAMGSMPTTTLILEEGNHLFAKYDVAEGCQVRAGGSAKSAGDDVLRQKLAREFAYCMIFHDLYLQVWDNPQETRWLTAGLSMYLSDVVYPNVNLELDGLPAELAFVELATTVPERNTTNWAFFEYMGKFLGPEVVMAIMRNLPESGDLVAALAAEPGVADLYHGTAGAMTDGDVVDASGGAAEYVPVAWELSVSGPTELPVEVPTFGLRRIHLKIDPGQYGCFETFSQGDINLSWRPGAPSPGHIGTWQDHLPDTLEGESVLLLTTVHPGAHFTLDVYDISDDPECDEEEDEDGATGSLGDVLEGLEDLCSEFCDPSTYYWGPMNFETIG